MVGESDAQPNLKDTLTEKLMFSPDIPNMIQSEVQS